MNPTIILNCGNSGVGKTVAACTFPKPLCLLDFDNGFDSVITNEIINGKLHISEINKIIRKPFFLKEKINLSFLSTRKETGGPPPGAQHAKELTDSYDNYLLNLRPGYKTLVIDSVTRLYHIWKMATLFVNGIPSIRLTDYELFYKLMESYLLPMLRSLSVDYIVLNIHTKIAVTKETNVTSEFPVGLSNNLGRLQPGLFPEVWQQVREGDNQPLWLITSEGLFVGASSRAGIKNRTEAHFDNVKYQLNQVRERKGGFDDEDAVLGEVSGEVN